MLVDIFFFGHAIYSKCLIQDMSIISTVPNASWHKTKAFRFFFEKNKALYMLHNVRLLQCVKFFKSRQVIKWTSY